MDIQLGATAGDDALCISRIFRKESQKNVTASKVEPVGASA